MFLNLYLSGQTITLSGYVIDAKTGEALIGASIYDTISTRGTITNNYGFYSLRIRKNIPLVLSASYVGYKVEKVAFLLSNDTTLIIRLQESNELQEVIVTGNSIRPTVVGKNLSKIELPITTIEGIAAIAGETDVLKTIQLLPGIQGGTEGTTGLHVRGGGKGENLILLDGIPVYNASHLFGFFSVFNGSAVKNIRVYKGGFPARYGGRASSVVDVRTREGSTQKWQGEGSIGLISSKLTIEVPLIRDKMSLLISGRRTYLDAIVKPLKKRGDIKESFPDYYFYDFNAKLQYKISERNKLYLSLFTGKDHIIYKDKTEEFESEKLIFKDSRQQIAGWKNTIASLRWNYLYTNRLFGNATLAYSHYQYFSDDDILSKTWSQPLQKYILKDYESNYHSYVNDFVFNYDFDYTLTANHFLRFGWQNNYRYLLPGKQTEYLNYEAINLISDTTTQQIKSRSLESSLYIEDEWQISDNFSLISGLRYTGYYTNKKLFTGLQPRLSLRWQVQKQVILQASYSRSMQYVQLLSASGLLMPTDIWIANDTIHEPLVSDQFCAGLKWSSTDYTISVEAFYKTLNNLLDYSDGTNYRDVNKKWQNQTESGKGETYGIELLVQKTTGRLNGWIAYTWSKSERIYDEINNHKTFPYDYDRPHDMSITLTYNFSKSFAATAVWVYASGIPLTIPTEYLYEEPFRLPDYIENAYTFHYPSRNNYRISAYHRLDLSIKWIRAKKRFESVWALGVYNAYNRKNPVYAYVVGIQYRRIKEASLFPIIPFINYQFKF